MFSLKKKKQNKIQNKTFSKNCFCFSTTFFHKNIKLLRAYYLIILLFFYFKTLKIFQFKNEWRK